MSRLLFKDISVLVAWNEAAQAHETRENVNLLVDGSVISSIGKDVGDPDATVISARGKLVLPGFVNIHTHPAHEPLNKGLSEEVGTPTMGMSSLYEFLHLMNADPDTHRAAALLAIWEMLKSGVTTFVDYSPPRPNWLADVAGTGIRTVVGPMFRDGRWKMTASDRVDYLWDPGAGKDAYDHALSILDAAAAHPSGKLSGMMAPAQIDTCTPELLELCADEARRRKIPIQIHAAQSVVEFDAIWSRHGVTPIKWLANTGMLAPDLIIGHAIYLDQHSRIQRPPYADMELLAQSGASVAHCPIQFGRRGNTLENFGLYRRNGINVAIGTDTYPHNFLEEMRWASVLSRVSARDVRSTSLTDIFRAGTVGGADALGRKDIGRLAPGMAADLVMADLNHPMMMPTRDPVSALLYSALDRAVTDVFVGGDHIVRDGEVLTIDIGAVLAQVREGYAHAVEKIPQQDYASRTIEDIAPSIIAKAVHEY